MTTTIDPAKLDEYRKARIAYGSHDATEGEKCSQEWAAYLAGEPHSYSPQCVDPVVAHLLRSARRDPRHDRHEVPRGDRREPGLRGDPRRAGAGRGGSRPRAVRGDAGVPRSVTQIVDTNCPRCRKRVLTDRAGRCQWCGKRLTTAASESRLRLAVWRASRCALEIASAAAGVSS